MIPLAGVIGDPIAHSRSPLLHGHWLRRHGIDGHYIPLHVRASDLGGTLALLPRLGFRGVNVTLPHKEAVFALADEATDRARAVGAANTLTFRDGRIHADNTDGAGFIANLRQGAPDWAGDRPALVLGAGGAARGVVAALLDEGVPTVTLANRTAARAEALAGQFDDRVRTIDWNDTGPALADHALLVNTTSLGMTGQPPLDVDLSALPGDAVVTDIVYTPLSTPLLTAAQARGNPTVDGLGMLLHQAAPGFAAWFGVTPQVDDDLRRAVLG
ncbi:shikimate dehydrogenase [Jannaschia rubra]|uniref:Shikimate dehydrogenase (NADP(+)) n=1 Tax=Jannaschia rubra TaxID=282197 RepID=A0A0M6XRI7_9RHOB|nr:shikimate dehydrogenase [Jannaschia rubra]CTQ32781.1 Shikimate dehydrogenase [Jannaschia rubra]SFF89377.1 shikimate dehydrogenase [Jannaschia rubra]